VSPPPGAMGRADIVEAMIEAARHARNVSRDGLTVELLVTEEGWVVRGEADRDGRRWRYSMDLTWSEFDANPALLPNTARLTGERLNVAPNRI
jgi:hypothetical protein